MQSNRLTSKYWYRVLAHPRISSPSMRIGILTLLLASFSGARSFEPALAGDDGLSLLRGNQVAKPSAPLSSEGAMAGVTLQMTRVYSTKSAAQPTTVVWKSRKLFKLTRMESYSGQMGKPGDSIEYFGWYPTYFGYSVPVFKDDTVYFSLFVGDGYFFALDSKTGEDKKNLILRNTQLSPLAVAGDQVFMGTSDGNLRSLDRRTGKTKWQLARKDYRFDLTAPLVANGVLFLGGAQNIVQGSMPINARPSCTFHALDADSGQPIWMVKVKGVPTSPAVDAGTIYFGDDDRHLFALDTKTGTERWRFGAGDSVRSLCVSQDAVYCSDARGDLYAVDKKTGSLIWKANKAGKVYTALALDKGLVYYGGKDPFIHAIDAKTGEERWKFKAAGPCSAPVIADGVLYCASADRNLYAIDCSTGQEKWKYKCQNTLSLSPLITDNAIYVLDDDGYMWALR